MKHIARYLTDMYDLLQICTYSSVWWPSTPFRFSIDLKWMNIVSVLLEAPSIGRFRFIESSTMFEIRKGYVGQPFTRFRKPLHLFELCDPHRSTDGDYSVDSSWDRFTKRFCIRIKVMIWNGRWVFSELFVGLQCPGHTRKSVRCGCY